MRPYLGGVWQRLLAKLPTQCLLCEAWPVPQPICAACLSQHAPLRPRCLGCALPLPENHSMHSPVLPCAHCLRQPLPLAACWAAVDYAAPWAALVRRWKFGGQPALAQAAAQTMLARLPWAQILAQADVLLPIAPSTPRLQARGFDHTRVLAQSLLQPLQRQIPHCPPRAPANCLQRLPEANDAHQAGRKRQARICALKGAFVLLPTALPALQGQRVLLLDDVMTTGATLSSAAQTLLAAGAAQVSAVVWARTAARV